MAAEISREAQMSIVASSMFPGFRFSPTDDELISFYLKKKLEGFEKSVQIIADIEIYNNEPWDLPAKSVIQSSSEWFFFSPRGKKYPNGNQTKRATALGYWKATGKERNVKSGSEVIGTKRTLVFHTGRAPKGERTEWIMHEYSMTDKSHDFLVVCRLRRNSEFRQHNNSNQASSSQRNLLSYFHDRNDIVSEVGVEPKEKVAESYLKKFSSSSYSQPCGHVDSTSESNHKYAAEALLVETSGLQTENGADDFYTEILKDEIIKLDESAPHAAFDLLPTVCNGAETERKSEHERTGVLEWLPNQGTANRRIRLKKKKLVDFAAEKSDTLRITQIGFVFHKAKFSELKRRQSWSVNIFSWVRTVGWHVRVGIFVLFISLALFAFSQLLGFGILKGMC